MPLTNKFPKPEKPFTLAKNLISGAPGDEDEFQEAGGGEGEECGDGGHVKVDGGRLGRRPLFLSLFAAVGLFRTPLT